MGEIMGDVHSITSMGAENGTTLVDIETYAGIVGTTDRTVRRWLGNGEIPGAERDVSGKWEIPSTAVRRAKTPEEVRAYREAAAGASPAEHSEVGVPAMYPNTGAEMVLAGPITEPTLVQALDDETGYLSIADASHYLGIPQAQILANPERFDLAPVGVNGSQRVPQRIIRRIMGI
jgi:hypothetical protein